MQHPASPRAAAPQHACSVTSIFALLAFSFLMVSFACQQDLNLAGIRVKNLRNPYWLNALFPCSEHERPPCKTRCAQTNPLCFDRCSW